ncbi:hypothetical protein Bca4012_038325 [Brassica carinata]
MSELEQRIATLEFDRDRKSMGVMVDSSSGKKLLLVKGAVENILERSTHIQLLDGSTPELDQYSRDLILQSMSSLKCLRFAYSDVPSDFATYDGSEDHPAHQQLLNPSNYSSIESNLTFVGFVGLRDPPRKEVRQTIEDCRTVDEDISSRSLTGKEFMDVQDKKNHLRQTGGLLFSRAKPKHKQEIVRLLKEEGEVVAMTGDGVNDAPALKLADIGVAMGSKGGSNMVLADDNFSTIVAVVGEGRFIYNNMKAFIWYMIFSNIGEVALIFLTAALGIPEGKILVKLIECEEKFGVSCEKELTTEEVVKRHQIYGLNELEKPEGTSIFKLILEQFNGTLVRILLAAVVISFALAFVDDKEGGEMGITAFVEPHVVFLILIVNAIVGIWQETNAEKALEALKEIQSQQATVMRDGNKVSNLPAKELVVGDIVELRVGDKVPSDMCMVALISSTLRVEQGSLTGESEAVRTTFVNGNGICLVTDTGMSTEIGRVHSQIQEAA